VKLLNEVEMGPESIEIEMETECAEVGEITEFASEYLTGKSNVGKMKFQKRVRPPTE